MGKNASFRIATDTYSPEPDLAVGPIANEGKLIEEYDKMTKTAKKILNVGCGSDLLQAIARTNRPFRNIKEAGLIIDYVGILREYEAALSMYDKEDINSSAIDIKDSSKQFASLIKDCENIFKPLSSDKVDRDTLVKAARVILIDQKKSKEFLSNYRHLKKLFGFLGYNETKDYIKSFKWLTAIYVYYSKLTKRTDEDIDTFVKQYFNIHPDKSRDHYLDAYSNCSNYDNYNPSTESDNRFRNICKLADRSIVTTRTDSCNNFTNHFLQQTTH